MKHALLIMVLFTACGIARANPLDTFGWTPRGEALGGALVGAPDDVSGVYYNAAGAALNDHARLALGWSGGDLRMRINGIDPRPAQPHGTSLGLVLPVRLFSATLALGAVFYLPDQSLARIHFVPSSQPQLFRLEDGLQHVVVHLTAALRVGGFAIGAGASILADAAGRGVRFDVGILGGEKTGRGDVDVSLPIRAAALVGIALQLGKHFQFGAQFRDRLDLSLRLDILANVRVTDALTGDALVSLRSTSFYQPRQLAFGGAVDLPRHTKLFFAYEWNNWRAFTSPVPELRVLVALGISPSLVDAIVPKSPFRDSHVARLAVEHRRVVSARVGLTVRGGYVYESSPVPEQRGLTSFADNQRHTLSVGAGVELRRVLTWLPRPVRLDAALSVGILPNQDNRKAAPYFGQDFHSSGVLLHGSLMVEVEL